MSSLSPTVAHVARIYKWKITESGAAIHGESYTSSLYAAAKYAAAKFTINKHLW